MKEYKVTIVDSPKKLEGIMNQMAQSNWEVKNVCYWETSLDYKLVVTFEREKVM